MAGLAELAPGAVAIQIPIGQEAGFRGVVNLVSMTATVYADDVLAGLAGDFNTDIKVNGADLGVWTGAVNASTAAGDANGDGLSDGADILIWQQGLNPNLGAAAPAIGAVPEPSSALLLAAGLAFVGRRGMKRLAR